MFSVEKRWRQHCKDSRRKRCAKRPLYDAMNKHGVENFTIEEIEECLEEDACDREIYWIQHYNSYRDGYNATLGGDSKHYIDYDLVVKTYLQVGSQKETSEQLNIAISTVRKILKIKGIHTYSIREIKTRFTGKVVHMYSLSNKYIRSFNSLMEAARYVTSTSTQTTINSAKTHISDVCKGRRKSAYGYKWSYDGPEYKTN